MSSRKCPRCESTTSSVSTSVNGFNVSTCDLCGFLFVSNPPDSSIADNPTSELRHTEVPTPKRRHYYTRNLIDRLGAGNRVIEIGSGFGALGKLLTTEGYDYLGFEPDTGRADVASSGGVPVEARVFDPSEVTGSVDFVVIDNVLEHVHDPQSILNDAAEVLSDTGTLIVIVPNRYDIRRAHPGWAQRHFWIPPAHINFFRWKDLQRMCSSAGFSIRPFPVRSHMTDDLHKKDLGFMMKAMIEKTGFRPLGLYAYGSLSE